MTEPTDAEQYLNVADQCVATATSELAASILVDGGSGTLRQLLNDAADAIRAGWTTPQPTQAQAEAVPLTNARLQDISLNYSDSEDECTGFRDGWREAEKHYGIKGGQHGPA